jgi:hypothetical protein
MKKFELFIYISIVFFLSCQNQISNENIVTQESTQNNSDSLLDSNVQVDSIRELDSIQRHGNNSETELIPEGVTIKQLSDTTLFVGDLSGSAQIQKSVCTHQSTFCLTYFSPIQGNAPLLNCDLVFGNCYWMDMDSISAYDLIAYNDYIQIKAYNKMTKASFLVTVLDDGVSRVVPLDNQIVEDVKYTFVSGDVNIIEGAKTVNVFSYLNEEDVFSVAAYDNNGLHLWRKSFPEIGNIYLSAGLIHKSKENVFSVYGGGPASQFHVYDFDLEGNLLNEKVHVNTHFISLQDACASSSSRLLFVVLLKDIRLFSLDDRGNLLYDLEMGDKYPVGCKWDTIGGYTLMHIPFTGMQNKDPETFTLSVSAFNSDTRSMELIAKDSTLYGLFEIAADEPKKHFYGFRYLASTQFNSWYFIRYGEKVAVRRIVLKQ